MLKQQWKKADYAIFTNKKNGKKLVYYPCPKNGNTSAKLFFAKHVGLENKLKFISDEIPEHKQQKSEFVDKINLVNFLPSGVGFSKVDADVKCCIVRDPIKRFLSAFKNRILFHKDLDFKNLSIDEILKKLESGRFENKHFLPQTFFLGKDINYFTFYADIENIDYFTQKVNDFFDKNILFPKLQTGGNNINIRLNEQQIERIKKIYIDDFNFIYK